MAVVTDLFLYLMDNNAIHRDDYLTVSYSTIVMCERYQDIIQWTAKTARVFGQREINIFWECSMNI